MGQRGICWGDIYLESLGHMKRMVVGQNMLDKDVCLVDRRCAVNVA